MSRLSSSILAISAGAALWALSAPALAHHSSKSASSSTGVAVTSISHSEMAVIARYRSEIVELASMQPSTDRDFRNLLAFARTQHAHCAWGLMPGAAEDEDSPFNESAHAYLSAAKALLVRMEGINFLEEKVRAVATRIGADNAAGPLVICRYSDEHFNTSDVIYPDWSRAVGHGPTAFAMASAGLIVLGLGSMLFGAERNATRNIRPRRATA